MWIFSRRIFQLWKKIKGNLELYELQDRQGGAPISGGGKVFQPYPVIDRDNETTLEIVGLSHLMKTLIVYRHVKANVE